MSTDVPNKNNPYLRSFGSHWLENKKKIQENDKIIFCVKYEFAVLSNGVDISILFFPEELFIAWWVDFIKILLPLQVSRKNKRPFSLCLSFDFISVATLGRGRVCRGGNKFSFQYSCDSYYFLNGFEMLLDVGNSLSWFLMINLWDSQTRIREIRTTLAPTPLKRSLSEVRRGELQSSKGKFAVITSSSQHPALIDGL